MRLFALLVAGLLALPLTSYAQCRHAGAFGFGYVPPAVGFGVGVDPCAPPVALAAPAPTYGYGVNSFAFGAFPTYGYGFNRFGFNGYANGFNRFGFGTGAYGHGFGFGGPVPTGGGSGVVGILGAAARTAGNIVGAVVGHR